MPAIDSADAASARAAAAARSTRRQPARDLSVRALRADRRRARTAEHVFCKAWPKKGVVLAEPAVPHARSFTRSTRASRRSELPHPEVFELDSQRAVQGRTWPGTRCRRRSAQDAAAIAFVCIEVSDNAAGGCPVSLQHLRRGEGAAGAALDPARHRRHAHPRERAVPDRARSGACAGKDVWAVVREILVLRRRRRSPACQGLLRQQGRHDRHQRRARCCSGCRSSIQRRRQRARPDRQEAHRAVAAESQVHRGAGAAPDGSGAVASGQALQSTACRSCSRPAGIAC